MNSKPEGRRIAQMVSAVSVVLICAAGLNLAIDSASATDGVLDPSFGADGKVLAPRGGNVGEYVTDMDAFSDGSLIVVGWNINNRGVIQKFTPNGDPDPNFGEDGRVSDGATMSSLGVVESVHALSNGSFIVAGKGASSANFVVAKFNVNGTLDTSFGTDGVVTTDVGGLTRPDQPEAVVVSSSGAIIVVGYSNVANNDFAVAKYTATGELDTTFSDDGLLTVDVSGRPDGGLVAELLADGSLIIGGYSYIATESAAAIMMVTPAGAVDTTFGVEGVARASFVTSSDEQVESISVANDGSIYAAISVDNSSSDLLVAKYSALGILQSAFGDSGLARVDVAGGQDITKRVQVLWDGSILLGGSAFVSNTFDLAVAKLTTDGALDSSFGVSGKTSVSLSASNDLVEAMTVTPTGNIVLAASADLGGSTSFGIARFSGAIPVTTTTTTLPAATSVPSNPSTPMTTTPENTPTTVSAPAESVVLDLPLPTQPLVADTALVVGEAVTLEFGGFVPGEFVQLIVASTPQVIATGYADPAGIIRLTGSLPAGLTNGQHSLALFAPVSGRGVRQPITIEQAVLPATGMDGDLGAYLRFALLVIVVGVFPVVLRRGRTVRQS